MIRIFLCLFLTLTGCMGAPYQRDIIIMRHGESEANKAHLIASQLANAGKAYGLTDKGRAQVVDTAHTIKDRFNTQFCVVTASPLLRTQQTAVIVRDILRCTRPVITDAAFIERSFAAFELQSDDNYKKVWAYDVRGQDVGDAFNHQVEELRSVQTRTQTALAQYRQKFPSDTIIIVTHGDVASNIIATDQGKPLAEHRQVGGLPTAGYYRLRK